MLDLKIINGKVFVPGSGFFNVGIGVKEGKVVLLGDSVHLPEARSTIDAKGKFVIPGLVDPHVHLGIFKDFEQECETETRAALAGGVTTIGVFMGGGESYLGLIDNLIKTIEKKSSVDVFLHLSIFTDTQMAEMEEYYKRFGITDFKFYMCGVKGVFPGVSDGFILEGFKKVAAMGAIACVHCEDQSIADIAFERISKEKPNGTLEDWAESSPNIAEEIAIIRAFYLASQAGNRMYIVHTSTKQGADRLAELYKAGGEKIFAETTSAYLSISKKDPSGLLAKMVPPIRGEEDIEGLWNRVKDGTLSSFGTDNVSLSKAVKQAEKGMLGAMPGYPIVQTHLPALLTEGYHKRKIPLDTILIRATKNPAQIFGIYPRKGTIAADSDADLVVLDIDKEVTVTSKALFSYSDFSMYEGRKLKGWPEVVIKNGKVAFKDGKITLDPGNGRYLKRTL
jgi:dihydropyrimidinase